VAEPSTSALRIWGSWLLAAATSVGLTSCGYVPVRSVVEARPHLAIVLVERPSAFPEVERGLLQGAMRELARNQLLRDGTAEPRIEVECVKIARNARAIGVRDGDVEAGGEEQVVVARAQIRDGGHVVADTGDMSTASLRAAGFSSTAEELREARGWQVAANELGQRLVMRLLGDPVPTLSP
jgi:hypothetical protein